MGKGTSYKPLDVELDFKYDGVDQEGPRLQGWCAARAPLRIGALRSALAAVWRTRLGGRSCLQP